MNNILNFKSRNVYGNDLIYPTSDSQWILRLTKTKTINRDNLIALDSAGFSLFIDDIPYYSHDIYKNED